MVYDCLVTFVEKEVFSTVSDRDIISSFQEMGARRMQIDLKLFESLLLVLLCNIRICNRYLSLMLSLNKF